MKFYILDTNVILDDPYAIYNFKDNTVIITQTIINETDKFKRGNEDRNVNAREFNRQLKALKKRGKLNEGVKFNDSIIKFEFCHPEMQLPQQFNPTHPDNTILQVALYFKSINEDVIIITNDINMSIKADVLNISVEDYKANQSALDYTGRDEIYMSPEDIEEGVKNKKVLIKYPYYNKEGNLDYDKKFYPNEYLIIHNNTNNSTLIGKVSKDCVYIEFITDEQHPYDITPLNVGQTFCIDALMRDTKDLPLVIISGGSGTGKDFVSLACGLEQTFNNQIYRKILITREIQTLGKDIGTLPGTEEEKIDPFLRGFIDNLEILVDSQLKKNNENTRIYEKEIQNKIDYLFDTGIIKAEAVAYMRGRSIRRQFIIIDEAQNLTITQMLGILTRVAEDTKIVILGDVAQIDSPYLTEKTNGLAWAMNLMKDSPYCAQISMLDEESERSDLVKDILNRL